MGSLLIIISPLFVVVEEKGEGKDSPFFTTLTILGTTFIFMGYLLLSENGVGDLTSNAMATAKETKEDPVPIEIKNNVKLDAPIIKQFPELPRGCEVTSLAMLLQYEGIEVGKMELAELIVKNPTPLRKENGRIFWGHPNDGFIGNMYTYSQPGYGVYHETIKELADRFLPGRVIDLTGSDFEDLKTYLSMNIPVWVITNTTHKKLPESYFETWQTPRGEVKITYKEHSVLITGYDENYIYFNDPISGVKNRKSPAGDFMEAWVQMGSQAISYFPQGNQGNQGNAN